MNPYIVIVIGLILIIGLFFVSKNNKTPDNLGVNQGKLAPLSSKPNCVSTQAQNPAKEIEPLHFKDSLKNSRDILEEIILSDETSKLIELKDDYIHCTYSSKLLKFKDDVEFYFDIETKLIHIRSASRVGYSDMNVNKDRYLSIRKKYESAN